MSRLVLGLVRASHPEPAAAVTVAAGLLAWGVGHRPAGVLAVLATVGASQLATGWANDALDAGRDTTVGRTDKPVASGAVGRGTVALAATAAALATPLFALTTNRTAAFWITAALVSALLYDWPLKATAASVLPYAFSFGALPAFVVLALPGAPTPPVWLVAAGACLGAGAHFANVLPDLADDARTGIRGLPHRIGPVGSWLAAAGLLLAATVILVFGPPGPPSVGGLAAVVTAAVVPPLSWYGERRAGREPGRPVAAFRAVLLVALIDVVLLVASGRVV
ncbi:MULTISPECIES: UbiA family prenyltransferase [Micromonospora]|uniref:4-hydroxybenzoate polyprenyltransferase n=1 Tax=Micromonospora yangpuensis TaxID=683228 RepID=A0A1C6VEJ5_9ACTN|nr:UbiA family prenyltransferase [Micromonospora yangpuensis]GGM30293.1 membrane protein [Micromonospora yangpuensis]SCL64801.1 4-hydroxybenzoate polyprenyltransferase [Micromonospora yangpuensis]